MEDLKFTEKPTTKQTQKPTEAQNWLAGEKPHSTFAVMQYQQIFMHRQILIMTET